MKQSGATWLGDVPDHWHHRRLRNILNMHLSSSDKRANEGEWPVRLFNYETV